MLITKKKTVKFSAETSKQMEFETLTHTHTNTHPHTRTPSQRQRYVRQKIKN